MSIILGIIAVILLFLGLAAWARRDPFSGRYRPAPSPRDTAVESRERADADGRIRRVILG